MTHASELFGVLITITSNEYPIIENIDPSYGTEYLWDAFKIPTEPLCSCYPGLKKVTGEIKLRTDQSEKNDISVVGVTYTPCGPIVSQ